jgi:DNA-binding IclR family transcriptional regulator
MRVYLYTEVGESAVQTGAHIGRRGPLHVSAAGKSILANLPEERVDEIIEEHGLSGGGEKSVSTRENLDETLETARKRDTRSTDRRRRKGSTPSVRRFWTTAALLSGL